MAGERRQRRPGATHGQEEDWVWSRGTSGTSGTLPTATRTPHETVRMVRTNQVVSGETRSQGSSSVDFTEPRGQNSTWILGNTSAFGWGTRGRPETNALQFQPRSKGRSCHSFLLGNGGIPTGQNSTWILGITSAFGWEPEEGLINLGGANAYQD